MLPKKANLFEVVKIEIFCLLKKLIFSVVCILITLFFLASCTDPVQPEFEFKEGLIYIDAFATTTPESSYVTISETKTEFGINKSIPVPGAEVYFINTEEDERVALVELENGYFPPSDFALEIGELWELEVNLSDGRTYRSQPERVQPKVEVTSIDITYKPELLFSEAFDAFVPGHEITATFNDPEGEENYYYWQFKSYEKLIYCRECYNYTIFRNGECIKPFPDGVASSLKRYYTYSCEEDCWRIRYNENIKLFSDEFVNGKTVAQLPVGEVLLYTNDNILIELQQFSISSNAYRYLKTLKDIVDNNNGFNSPLPAALVGNIYNPYDSEEFVLGRFTAASTSLVSKYVERIFIEEPQLEPRLVNSPEGLEVPIPVVITAPCYEGPYRTGIRPDGWLSQ